MNVIAVGMAYTGVTGQRLLWVDTPRWWNEANDQVISGDALRWMLVIVGVSILAAPQIIRFYRRNGMRKDMSPDEREAAARRAEQEGGVDLSPHRSARMDRRAEPHVPESGGFIMRGARRITNSHMIGNRSRGPGPGGSMEADEIIDSTMRDNVHESTDAGSASAVDGEEENS